MQSPQLLLPILHYDWVGLRNCLFVVFPLKLAAALSQDRDTDWSQKCAASLIPVCLNKVLVCSNPVYCGGLFLDSWTLKLTAIIFTEGLVQTEIDPVLATSVSGSPCEPCLVDCVGHVPLVSKFYVKHLECLSSLKLENVYSMQHFV